MGDERVTTGEWGDGEHLKTCKWRSFSAQSAAKSHPSPTLSLSPSRPNIDTYQIGSEGQFAKIIQPQLTPVNRMGAYIFVSESLTHKFL